MPMNAQYRGPIDLPEVIPVFPLPGALLLPRGTMPLNIFEPRYLAMVDDALRDGRQRLGVDKPPAGQGLGLARRRQLAQERLDLGGLGVRQAAEVRRRPRAPPRGTGARRTPYRAYLAGTPKDQARRQAQLRLLRELRAGHVVANLGGRTVAYPGHP